MEELNSSRSVRSDKVLALEFYQGLFFAVPSGLPGAGIRIKLLVL